MSIFFILQNYTKNIKNKQKLNKITIKSVKTFYFRTVFVLLYLFCKCVFFVGTATKMGPHKAKETIGAPHVSRWIYTLQKLHTMSGNEKLQKHTCLQ